MKIRLHSPLAPNVNLFSLASSCSLCPLLSFPPSISPFTADFGFARYLQNNMMAATLCGSPMYMVSSICSYFLDIRQNNCQHTKCLCSRLNTGKCRLDNLCFHLDPRFVGFIAGRNSFVMFSFKISHFENTSLSASVLSNSMIAQLLLS